LWAQTAVSSVVLLVDPDRPDRVEGEPTLTDPTIEHGFEELDVVIHRGDGPSLPRPSSHVRLAARDGRCGSLHGAAGGRLEDTRDAPRYAHLSPEHIRAAVERLATRKSGSEPAPRTRRRRGRRA